MSASFWAGKRVLVTGHTGFKGSWLSLWLRCLGAQVTGFALAPPTTPSLFELAGVAADLTDLRGDVRDAAALLAAVQAAQPQIVLHLAAQPLVSEGYSDPAGTYASNVMGTLHLLEAVRQVPGVQACVVVTTDKVYANQEWPWGYREHEPLGGHDPYSSSKACCELLTQCWAASFFPASRYDQHGVALATARAGNVLGGGDFAANRLLPDIFRAWDAGQPLHVRYPQAVRPWQHVLEPLSGYLRLAQRLVEQGPAFAGAFNFGPRDVDMSPVSDVIDTLERAWPEPVRVIRASGEQPHEAGQLRLDSSLARSRLGWAPRWSLQQCLEQTLAWHRAWRQGDDLRALTLAQLHDYGLQP